MPRVWGPAGTGFHGSPGLLWASHSLGTGTERQALSHLSPLGRKALQSPRKGSGCVEDKEKGCSGGVTQELSSTV